jgi:hypothetical protein
MADVDLSALGAHVVSVFGPFNSRVLIEMPAEQAEELFPDGLRGAGPAEVLEAVRGDVEALRRRAPEVADSGLAASAVALAREIEHPYNSATSKSMCAKALQDALRELRGLAPAEVKADGIDEINAQRERRRARLAGAADLPSP